MAALMDYASRKKAEARRRAKAAYYTRCREAGLCTACGQPAEPGKSQCANHLKQAKDRSKIRRRKNRKAGHCEHCGTKVKETERLCPTCRLLSRERQRQWRAANEAAGMCYHCGRRKPKKGHRKCLMCMKSVNLAKHREWMRKKRTGQLRRLLLNPAAVDRLAVLISVNHRHRTVSDKAGD